LRVALVSAEIFSSSRDRNILLTYWADLVHIWFLSINLICSTNLVLSASRVLIRSGLVLLDSAHLLLSRSASVLLI